MRRHRIEPSRVSLRPLSCCSLVCSLEHFNSTMNVVFVSATCVFIDSRCGRFVVAVALVDLCRCLAQHSRICSAMCRIRSQPVAWRPPGAVDLLVSLFLRHAYGSHRPPQSANMLSFSFGAFFEERLQGHAILYASTYCESVLPAPQSVFACLCPPTLRLETRLVITERP